MQLRPRINNLEKFVSMINPGCHIRVLLVLSIEYNILEKKIEIFKLYKEKLELT